MRRSGIRCAARFETGSGLTQRRKDAKVFFRQTMDDPIDPLFHEIGSEIQNEPKLEPFEFEIREQLPMHLQGCIHNPLAYLISVILASWRLGVSFFLFEQVDPPLSWL